MNILSLNKTGEYIAFYFSATTRRVFILMKTSAADFIYTPTWETKEILNKERLYNRGKCINGTRI